ncbi:MAG: hypothetical protein AAGA48_18080 [Myxococcota bacterium]
MTPDVDTVFDEVRELAKIVGVAVDEAVLSRLAPHAATYAEFTVSPHAIELIVSDEPRKVCETARALGTSNPALAAFDACIAALSPRMVGLKVPFPRHGEGSPTLYVRLLMPLDEGLSFLQSLVPIDDLRLRLAHNAVLYGLAFMGEPLIVKTYTLCDDGFESFRLDARGLRPERKAYRASATVEPATGAWGQVVAALRKRGRLRADHVATLEVGDSLVEPKLYFERIGAVPTDWSAR